MYIVVWPFLATPPTMPQAPRSVVTDLTLAERAAGHKVFGVNLLRKWDTLLLAATPLALAQVRALVVLLQMLKRAEQLRLLTWPNPICVMLKLRDMLLADPWIVVHRARHQDRAAARGAVRQLLMIDRIVARRHRHGV